jgi:hypothetical protein
MDTIERFYIYEESMEDNKMNVILYNRTKCSKPLCKVQASYVRRSPSPPSTILS